MAENLNKLMELTMVIMKLKKDYDLSELETGDLCLGYGEIKLLFNVGPFPGGGDCLIIEADGNVITVNSADLIHDIEAYELYNEASAS